MTDHNEKSTDTQTPVPVLTLAPGTITKDVAHAHFQTPDVVTHTTDDTAIQEKEVIHIKDHRAEKDM